MKQLTSLCTAFILFFSSCHFTGERRKPITEKREISNISSINISNGFKAEVKIGPQAALTIEADVNMMQYIQTKVSGNELSIKLEGLDVENRFYLKAYITMPELKSVVTSDGANVKVIDPVKIDGNLDFTAHGGSLIEAEVYASYVEAKAWDGSTIRLRGKTTDYRAKAFGGGWIKSTGLLSENTKASAVDGGYADVNANVTLTAAAGSGGSIHYTGDAAINKNVSEGGSVNKN